MIIHDNIDNFLAADLHGDLSEEERSALHTHLVECAGCRKAHQETKIMNNILEENLASEKPDGAFEQRMLAGFRNRISSRNGGIIDFIAAIPTFRTARIIAYALVILALVELGRNLTGEAPQRRDLGLLSFAAKIGKSKQIRSGASGAQDFIQKANTPSGPESPLAQAAESGAASAETKLATAERVVVTGSEIPTAEEVTPSFEVAASPNPALANRKLIRNATMDLEVTSFDEARQKITDSRAAKSRDMCKELSEHETRR
jgi:hypothetical protein